MSDFSRNQAFDEGELVGSYRILSKLSEGGMGAVYLAEHRLLRRKAAVKVLLPRLACDPAVSTRFFNEARATALIRHPGIVEVLDFGHLPDGSGFLVLEYLEGESLAGLLWRCGALPPALVVEIGRQLAYALEAAHAKRIVHRDLKPDNIYLVPSTEMPGGIRVKVFDFGIAKLAPVDAEGVHTHVGAVMGTPSYMSPEAWCGASRVDRRADIYALGCILFKMVCGRAPFIAGDRDAMRAKHLQMPPPPLSAFAPGTPEQLEAVILRMLAKRADRRYQTMSELVVDLERIGKRHPPPDRMSIAEPNDSASLPSASDATRSLPAAAMKASPPPPRTRRSVHRFAAVAVAVVLGAVGLGGLLWHQEQHKAAAVELPRVHLKTAAADPKRRRLPSSVDTAE